MLVAGVEMTLALVPAEPGTRHHVTAPSHRAPLPHSPFRHQPSLVMIRYDTRHQNYIYIYNTFHKKCGNLISSFQALVIFSHFLGRAFGHHELCEACFFFINFLVRGGAFAPNIPMY